MIISTETICSLALSLIKCVADAFDDVWNNDFRLEKEINTAYGVTAVISVNLNYTIPGEEDNRSSISIDIYGTSVFKISFKYNEITDDDWKLTDFKDSRDRNKDNRDRKWLLLNVASEALVMLMMDMVHEYSSECPSLSLELDK